MPPPTPPRPLILGAGHAGLPSERHCRGWYWARHHTLQASDPLHFLFRIVLLEAPQMVLLGVPLHPPVGLRILSAPCIWLCIAIVVI